MRGAGSGAGPLTRLPGTERRRPLRTKLLRRLGRALLADAAGTVGTSRGGRTDSAGRAGAPPATSWARCAGSGAADARPA
ncbi:hypothetical protein, partial [Actinomadura sp. CNU-125]|uniref:hypothetical protein n=1 Tax=Actinomadura sp. CNU-125 TaxID=1904961 RepID=UPI0021CCEB62